MAVDFFLSVAINAEGGFSTNAGTSAKTEMELRLKHVRLSGRVPIFSLHSVASWGVSCVLCIACALAGGEEIESNDFADFSQT